MVNRIDGINAIGKYMPDISFIVKVLSNSLIAALVNIKEIDLIIAITIEPYRMVIIENVIIETGTGIEIDELIREGEFSLPLYF